MDEAAVHQQQAWHAEPSEAVCAALDSGPGGLAGAEVERRLQRYGENRLELYQPPSAWRRFLRQFHNVLIYVLLAAAVITAGLGEWVDTGVILGVVLVNALVGYIQEGRAERALQAIRRMLSPRTMVLRDNRPQEIDATRLVPGDIVLLQAGDRVPADLRLLRLRDLQIDEAILTGESVPARKQLEPVAGDASLGDRRCLAYSGTLVTAGQGRGIVVATGTATELGHISEMLGRVEQLTTPLLRKMAHFGHVISGFILILALLIAVAGVFWRDVPLGEMLLAAVGIAVAAIPEGLPALVTITLAIGVQRMAARQAIVRRLPAVETLGEVSVICTDKTGTLTRNEMTVRTVHLADRVLEVSGSGYDPHGGFLLGGQASEVDQQPELKDLLRVGALCNDAALWQRGGEWGIDGDPTEGSLLTAAAKGGLDLAREPEDFPRLDTIPFASEHKFMATLHHDRAGHHFICVKGAPEVVLNLARWERLGSQPRPLEREPWEARVEEIARHGHRTLALAILPLETPLDQLSPEDLGMGLTLLGLVGVSDPPRPEVREAIAQCHSAGIRVKMITGDHAVTAAAIGRELGLARAGGALTGAQLDELEPQALAERVDRVEVFARTTPEHKLRLVEALQARGEVVAMTGDGVNDAPALKRADIGVAMGRKGTEAAKEAAEMVLTDDNFASIVDAVAEGRTIYDNIRKAIVFMLPTNLAEAMVVTLAILAGFELPITPVQILWVNMITAVTLGLALAFEPAEENVMRRPPQAGQREILDGFTLWRTGFVAALMIAGVTTLFLLELAAGMALDQARTLAVNTLVAFEAAYLVNSRFFTRSSLGRGRLGGNRFVWLSIALVAGFQLLFTYAPPFQLLFDTTPLDAAAWARLLLLAAAVFLLVELEKLLMRRRRSARARTIV